MVEAIRKPVLILVAASLAFLVVWSRLHKVMPFVIPAAAAALAGAAVGVGGLRLCLLVGAWTSPWLALPAFLVIVCVGLVGGTCVANAFDSPIPAGAEDWDVGVGVFSLFWAVYAGMGTVLGCIMTFCVFIIRARGIP